MACTGLVGWAVAKECLEWEGAGSTFQWGPFSFFGTMPRAPSAWPHYGAS